MIPPKSNPASIPRLRVLAKSAAVTEDEEVMMMTTISLRIRSA